MISQIQGAGASTPLSGQTVAVEAVVVGDFQGSNSLNGFFLQSRTSDQDGDIASTT